MNGIVYVTGTNTGEGKTLLTALLLGAWRERGVEAHAIKPFATGSRRDSRILARLQRGALSISEITPYHFEEAVTPLVAARRSRRKPSMKVVAREIEKRKAACEVLLVEGAGGLLSPLGEGYSLAELIRSTGGKVLVTAKNRLGILNQMRLTFHFLTCCDGGGCSHGEIGLVLMNPRLTDRVSRSNPPLLKELLSPALLETVPFLGSRPVESQGIKKSLGKCKKTLARINQFVNLPFLLRKERGSGSGKN